MISALPDDRTEENQAQIKENILIAQAMGIRQIIVAVNKIESIHVDSPHFINYRNEYLLEKYGWICQPQNKKDREQLDFIHIYHRKFGEI